MKTPSLKSSKSNTSIISSSSSKKRHRLKLSSRLSSTRFQRSQRQGEQEAEQGSNEIDPTVDQDEYINPLHNASRWHLSARAYALRTGASLAFGFANFSSRAASRTIWVEMSLASSRDPLVGRDKIRIDVWLPPSILASTSSPSSPSLPSLTSPPRGRPAVINFHGGGFILGQGTDDARWCALVAEKLNAVVFSVNYRLAPSYPFPIPVEDCADAIMSLVGEDEDDDVDNDEDNNTDKDNSNDKDNNSDKNNNIDEDNNNDDNSNGNGNNTEENSKGKEKEKGRRRDRVRGRRKTKNTGKQCIGRELGLVDSDSPVFVTGFSAGGNLALSSWVLLNGDASAAATWGYGCMGTGSNHGHRISSRRVPNLAGLVLFYPLLDWTPSRVQKRATVDKPELTLTPSLTDVFDASYMYPNLVRSERHDPRLSPGLMSDDLLVKLPPVHLCACEHDMLAAESGVFAQRLRAARKQVSMRIVEGEPHAWDKAPSMSIKPNIAVEYEAAIREMKGWIES